MALENLIKSLKGIVASASLCAMLSISNCGENPEPYIPRDCNPDSYYAKCEDSDLFKCNEEGKWEHIENCRYGCKRRTLDDDLCAEKKKEIYLQLTCGYPVDEEFPTNWLQEFKVYFYRHDLPTIEADSFVGSIGTAGKVCAGKMSISTFFERIEIYQGEKCVKILEDVSYVNSPEFFIEPIEQNPNLYSIDACHLQEFLSDSKSNVYLGNDCRRLREIKDCWKNN